MGESAAEYNVLPPASTVALELIKKYQKQLLDRALAPEGKTKLEQSQYNQALEWISGLFADPSKQVYPSTEQPTPETFYYTHIKIGDRKHQVALTPSGDVIVMDTREPAELKTDRPSFLESRGPLKLPKVNVVSSVPAGMRFSADAPDDVIIYEESFLGDNHIGTKRTVITPEQTQKQIEEIAEAKISLPRRAEPGK